MKNHQTAFGTIFGLLGSSSHAATLLTASCLAVLSGHAAAAPLTLPVSPLFVSTSVNPNVMMLVDNSGSMDNVIWDEDFDPLTNYTNYSPNCNFGSVVAPCWNALDGNVIRQNLPIGAGGCAADHLPGIRAGDSAFRCIRLPDSRGTLTRFNGNYINYLFWKFTPPENNTAIGPNIDVRSLVPSEVRLQVAKKVSSDIVIANPDIRFGVSSFNAPVPGGNSAPGGRIDAFCGATQSNVLTAINGLSASANTPLAETYYEITRYFRGLSRHTGTGSGNYPSPMQFRCQKNFVIAVTDGFPTYDGTFPANDVDDVADATASLPNWDGLAPATSAASYPDFPQFSDGTTGLDQQPEGASLLLDDLAKFGYDIDVRKSGTDATGGSFEDPDFDPQNILTYTVGFAVQNQMLEDAAYYGLGGHDPDATPATTSGYFTASNASQLTAALQQALNDISARAGSFSSASLNSTSLNVGSRLFQARFNSANWTGQLRTVFISTGEGGKCPSIPIGKLCLDPQKDPPTTEQWEASAVLDSQNWNSGRTILTFEPDAGRGIPFRWGQLSPAQQNALRLPSDADGTLRQPRLQYIRGNRANESPTGFRVRSSVLGDIVNSDPIFVGAPNSALPFKGYSSFRAGNSSRMEVVYVGANDGMLHGFRVSDGREVLAYVPNMMFGTSSNLARLAANPYTHIWGVNGSPNVADVDLAAPGPSATPNWRSLLVSGMGYGGRGIFALDVTDPASFSEANAASIVKWEFSNSNDPDMGFVMNTPSIVKMKNGRWAAIFGNGYNSSTEQAALFIVFLDSPGGTWTAGTHYVKLPVGSPNNGNGLAGPAAVDLDGDSLVDYIYAGDLKGRMWQFNVNSEDPAEWAVGYNGTALFAAVDAGGVPQPITATPEVGLNLLTGTNKDDLVVYFGTGRYLASGDNTRIGQRAQTFYGIFADPIATPGSPPIETPASPSPGRNSLLQQFVEQEVTVNSGDRARITSRNPLTIGTHAGWYIDLFNTNGNPAATGPNLGERQISRPILRFGRIVFTTLVPSDDACDPDGSGWLMELDARDGGQPRKPSLDITDDLIVDNNDIYDERDPDDPDDDINISGIGSAQGILSTPAVLYVGREGIGEVKYSTRSDGSTAVIGEAASDRVGRITWREIAP